MKNAVVIIPSFNPDDKLIILIHQLKQFDLNQIIIINDGSKQSALPYFDQAKALGCTIITHDINLGKGRALKTAFSYIIENYPSNTLAVCVDADGQHSVKDTLSCLALLEQNPNCLILGCRQFNKSNIPLRSKFGNKLTRFIFKMLCGVKVSDTQTGLRALTPTLMKQFLSTKGNRFEYEMNMLIDTKEKGIPIKEVAIDTIYIEENKTSHFNPFLDSFRIYKIFLKFILSSLLSFIIDISIFAVAVSIFDHWLVAFGSISIATIIARITSSLVNYTLNKNRVFNVEGNRKSTFFKYYSLCIVQLCCSAFFVNLLYYFIPINKTVIKLVVDIILFVISFQIQREWVFKKHIKRKNS